jgi:toxin-antitoxin system PIN domain toxin
MICLDTNVIIAAMVKSDPNHDVVDAWLSTGVDAPLAMTQTNVAEALRLLTHPRVFPKPLKIAPAVKALREFVEYHSLSILDEAGDWWLELSQLGQKIPAFKGNDIFDARIALAMRFNGIRKIATFDSGFMRFDFVSIIPLG